MEAVAHENDLYASSLAGFAERRFESDPAWLAEIRREAFARFSALGLPSARSEEWKYTNVARIGRTPFRPASGPGTVDVTAAFHFPDGDGPRIVFVNGRYSAELSRTGDGEAVFRSLREALRESPQRVEPHLAKHAAFRDSAFTALNTAFLEDGAFVLVPRGAAVAAPIHLVFLSGADDSGEPAISHPRILIVAEPNSQASVIESYLGQGAYFTNAVTEIVCGEGSVLSHYKVQRESLTAFHVQTLQAVQDRASSFTSHNICLGGDLARTDLNVLFSAEGSDCTLNGLFLAAGTQHMDNHTLVDHARPHCTSRQLYKGILDGRSRGVFHGKVVVRPDAQKTDAIQVNKNLLLSREALVNSTPALEILADDVKCKHGSTIGQLDANALFYLRSRGIAEEEARALLTYGFAADLAGRLRVPWIREEVESFLGLSLSRTAEAS